MMERLTLAGHADAFPMTSTAKRLVLEYLAAARASSRDPEHDDLVRDIETDLGDHFRAALDGGYELDDTATTRILQQFGPLDVEQTRTPRKAPLLCRIDDGRMLSGLCLGLATRAQLRVDWLRTVAFFLLLLTGGLLGLAYLIALLFAPRIATTHDYRAMIDEEADPPQ